MRYLFCRRGLNFKALLFLNTHIHFSLCLREYVDLVCVRVACLLVYLGVYTVCDQNWLREVGSKCDSRFRELSRVSDKFDSLFEFHRHL